MLPRANPRLLAALVSLTGNAEIGSDAVDEAGVRAIVRWERVASMDNRDARVYRVAINRSKRR